MRRQRITAVALLSICCLLLPGCSRTNVSAKSDKAADQPLTVKAAPPTRRDITRMVETVGTLVPLEEVNVSSEVEGRIEKIFVDVGDRVQKGQVLLAIEPEEFQYALDARISELRQTRARLGADGENGKIKKETEVPEVQKAAAELQQSKLNYDRARDLFRQALIPRQQLDNARAQFNSAQATYDATIQQVRVTKAALSQYQAEVDLARKKLRDTQIRAPFTGWIKQRLVSPGQYLKVQTPVYTLIDSSKLKFSGSIPEKMAPWVHVGGSVDLQVDAYPNRTFSGKISRIEPASNEQNRSFLIEAMIDNSNNLLKPGFFAKASIVTDKQDTVLTVPASALLYNYGVYKVFAIQGNRVAGRQVTIGDRIGNQVEIVQGVQESDLVAIDDVQKLTEGMHVATEPQNQLGAAPSE